MALCGSVSLTKWSLSSILSCFFNVKPRLKGNSDKMGSQHHFVSALAVHTVTTGAPDSADYWGSQDIRNGRNLGPWWQSSTDYPPPPMDRFHWWRASSRVGNTITNRKRRSEDSNILGDVFPVLEGAAALSRGRWQERGQLQAKFSMISISSQLDVIRTRPKPIYTSFVRISMFCTPEH